MIVKCHNCKKKFQHYGVDKKYVWCTEKCLKEDKKKRKENKL